MTDGHSNAGLCTIPVAALVKLLAAGACCDMIVLCTEARVWCSDGREDGERGAAAAVPAAVACHPRRDAGRLRAVWRCVVCCRTCDCGCSFKFTFEIGVHCSEWTMVKLLPDSIAVTQTHIGLRDGNEDGDAQGAGLCV